MYRCEFQSSEWGGKFITGHVLPRDEVAAQARFFSVVGRIRLVFALGEAASQWPNQGCQKGDATSDQVVAFGSQTLNDVFAAHDQRVLKNVTITLQAELGL